MNDNLAYKDERREELIDGKIVMLASPSINHSQIAYNIARKFGDYLDGKPCRYFPDGVTVELSNDDHFVPDGMVVCDPSKIGRNVISGAPDLVIEILSPSTARRDRKYKLDVYEKAGVREYWIIDPDRLTLEQYIRQGQVFSRPDVFGLYPPQTLAEMLEEDRAAIEPSFPCGIFPELSIQLQEIFDRVL